MTARKRQPISESTRQEIGRRPFAVTRRAFEPKRRAEVFGPYAVGIDRAAVAWAITCRANERCWKYRRL
jgi:hypothetical protein